MSAPIEGVGAGAITGITNTIQKITPPSWGIQEERATGLDEVKDSPFGSLFSSLIQNVKDTDAEFTQAQYLLATGQLDDAHTLPIAEAKAGLTLDVFLTLRNKTLESYNELIKINV